MHVRKCVTCDGVCACVCVAMRHDVCEPVRETILKASFGLCARKSFGLTHPSTARAKGCLTSKRVPSALPMSYREIGTGLCFSSILHSDHPIKPINPITQLHNHTHTITHTYTPSLAQSQYTCAEYTDPLAMTFRAKYHILFLAS